MNLKLLIAALFALLNCLDSSVYGVELSPNIKFELINNRIGLKSDYISGIERDERGFMWFATIEGICRYDGKEIKYYTPFSGNGNIEYSKEIRVLKKTPQSTFLLGTGRGLFSFDPKSEIFSPINPDELSQKDVSAIEFDGEGNMWIGTRQGLYFRGKETGQIELIPVAEHSPVAKSANIKAIHRDRDDNIWIGYWNGGISRYNAASKDYTSINLGDNQSRILCFYESPNGDIYAGGWKGQLLRIAKNSNQGEYIFEDISQRFLFSNRESAPIYFVKHESATNKYWIGTNHGIYILSELENPQLLRHLHSNLEDGGLANNNVATAYYDEENQTMWFGTRGGGVNVLRLTSSRIRSYPLTGISRRFGDVSVRAFCYDAAFSRMWLSVRDAGLFAIDEGGELQKTSLECRGINDIIKLKTRDELWLATQRDGLCIVQLKGENLPAASQASKLTNIKHKNITRLYEDSKGRVWVGCNDGLVVMENINGKWQSKPISIRNRVVGIAEGANGYIWAATRLNGVFRIHFKNAKAQMQKYDISTSGDLPYNNVFAIYADSQFNIWLGMSGIGLFKYNGESDEFENANDLVSSNLGSVNSILEQHDDALWLGTNTGVYYYNFEKESSPYLLHFDQGDGLLRDICVDHAIAEDGKGNIYIGAMNGYSVIDSSITHSSLKYRLVLSDIKINDETIFYPNIEDGQLLADGEIVSLNLNHTQNNIAFQLSTLSFAKRPNCRYKYMLEGLDKHWSESAENTNVLQYNDLAWGRYVFRAVNISNPELGDIEVVLNIKRPIYASWWAILLYFAIAALVLYDMISNRIAKKRLLSRLQINIEENPSNEQSGHTSTIAIPETNYESIDEQFLNKAIEVINQNIDNSEFEVADFAQAMGVTNSTLYRKLKSLTGMSSNEFIRHLRLQVAHKLLSEKYKTITTSEAAYAVGFNIPKYFTKCFNKQFGYTPSQYRAQLLDKNEEESAG